MNLKTFGIAAVAAITVLTSSVQADPPTGACCLSSGECQDFNQASCDSAGGSYYGDYTYCSDLACYEGACCLPHDYTVAGGGCMIAVGAACQNMGGVPTGMPNCENEDCLVEERGHPGWNHVSTEIMLTKNEPTYWSAMTGQPKGVAPFTVLDPGGLPGRPANDGTQDRVLRGYVVAWAVDSNNDEIRWNHLKGDAIIINYDKQSAWEYNAWAFQCVANVANGAQTGMDPSVINLDGNEYVPGFDHLVLDFYASGSSPFSSYGNHGDGDGDWSGGGSAWVETDLTLHPITLDLRQEDEGPVTVKAKVDVWNQNEVKFNGTERCITCWDQVLLSDFTEFGVPNNFLYSTLQTNKGKARITGLRSDNCDFDYEFDPDVPFGDDPRDIVSQDASLLGVAAKHLTFQHQTMAGVAHAQADLIRPGFATAGWNLVGMGTENAVIRYDSLGETPESAGAQNARSARRARNGRRPVSGPNEGVGSGGPDRVSATEKGSVLIFSKVEIRWDHEGNLKQDTFIDMANDFPEDVQVQMYFINGDAPVEPTMLPVVQGGNVH